MATCYRHPGRETGVSCSNCGRPICTECMTPTPVGMRCPECSKQKTRVTRGVRPSRADEPRVTYALIAINVIAFLASGRFGLGATESSSLYTDGALLGYGHTLGGAELGVYYGEYWRLVTGGFLHAGLIHIGFNMYLLWWLGSLLEPALGPARFGALYLTSLLAGSFGALLLEPNTLTVGASGAVFGLMGAAYLQSRSRGLHELGYQIGLLILFNVALSFVLSGISIGGHIGGLAGGALATLLIDQADRRRLPHWSAFAICAVISALAVAGAIAASVPPGA